MDADEVRREYQFGELHREDLSDHPVDLFDNWFTTAREAGIDLPDAMTLATATEEAHPSARMVLLREYDRQGFVFYTDYSSTKGRELQLNPRAALVFFWAPHDRQIRLRGSVERVSREQSEAYFQSRPVRAQLAAHASDQSRPIPDRAYLEEQFRNQQSRFNNGEVPLPDSWGGFRVRPDSVEFWQGREGRLHDRFEYRKTEDGTWTVQRLAP